MSAHLVWHEPADGVPARGYWDQALLEDTLSGALWRPACPVPLTPADTLADVPGDDGAVVVVPGARADVARLIEELRRLRWALVIVTSDEEARFDVDMLVDASPCQLMVWRQYQPHPRAKLIPIGYTPGTPQVARTVADPAYRPYAWAFLGQVTTDKRRTMVDALAAIDWELPHVLAPTEGFAQGIPQDAYLEDVAAAKVAPAPGGPCSPDSFRLWEALEVGTVPIGDDPAWWAALGQPVRPFPVLGDWRDVAGTVGIGNALHPLIATKSSAWWQGAKRDLVYALHDTVRYLDRVDPLPTQLADLVTVVMPTSPIGSHPSLAVIQETLDSLADVGLGACEVIITADGVREEQEHYRASYDQAMAQLVHLCEHEWPQVLPVVHGLHRHQSGMMRHAVHLVRTPLVLYVEHDAPMEGTIDWDACTSMLLSGEADLVRFHHESKVLRDHRHMMIAGPEEHHGAHFWRTFQWSQRPHLARTDYYRRVMAQHFEESERWMIEDRMHGALEVGWRGEGMGAWNRHRLWIYHQDVGDGRGIRRSRHLDGRGSDPKWVDS